MNLPLVYFINGIEAQDMHIDFHTLGCLSPDAEPKATDSIQDIQRIIQTLIEKKHAYQTANGDIHHKNNGVLTRKIEM